MATVYHALCVEDFCPNPDEDATFVLKRGQEYTIGQARDGVVRVFSRYWVDVPARLFVARQTLDGVPVPETPAPTPRKET